jgi:hypothetical protein
MAKIPFPRRNPFTSMASVRGAPFVGNHDHGRQLTLKTLERSQRPVSTPKIRCGGLLLVINPQPSTNNPQLPP